MNYLLDFLRVGKRISTVHYVHCLFLFVSGKLSANNIQVSNFTLIGKNTTSDFVNVKFDFSCENNWL